MSTYARQWAHWQKWLNHVRETSVGAVMHFPDARPKEHIPGTSWNFRYGERFERSQ